MAASKHRRWINVAKQLLDAGNNETFLSRMVRQCRQRGLEDIVVITHTDDIREAALDLGVAVFETENRVYTCGGFISSRELWQDENIVLLGDVWYTKATFDAIATSKGIKFFGNAVELFAFRFSKEHHEEIHQHLKDVLDVAYVVGTPGSGKIRPLQESFPDKHFIRVHDLTQDIDTEGEYKNFMREKANEGKYKYDMG